MPVGPIGARIPARGRSRTLLESSQLKRVRTVVRSAGPELLFDLLGPAGERQETLQARQVDSHSASFGGRFFLPGSPIVWWLLLTKESLGRSRDICGNL